MVAMPLSMEEEKAEEMMLNDTNKERLHT